MNFSKNYDIIRLIMDEGSQKTCNHIKQINDILKENPIEREYESILANLKQYEAEAAILKALVDRFDKGLYEVNSTEELEAIAGKIHFYLLDVEEETLEQIEEESISDEELQEVKELYTDMSKVIMDMELEDYQSNLKPDPVAFINKVNYAREKDSKELQLKDSEVAALIEIFNHISDHADWMYDVFNGEALRGIQEKVRELVRE